MINQHFEHRTNRIPAAVMMCALLLLCSGFFPALGQAEEAFHLSMGYTGSAYQETTSNDIKAAVSVLIRKIAWKHFGKSEARYYDNVSEMAADLKSGKVQVLCGPPEEFLVLRNRAPVDPILITSSSSGHETELLLLVRKDSGIRSLSALKNKSIVMPHRNPINSMFHVWIETLLMRNGSGSIPTFFSSVKEARTASRGIMPVFFRQAAACVVTRQIFNLTSELNPQIGRELVPIARMSKLSQGIISIDQRLPDDIKDKIRQAFLTLPESPDGKQLLMLFQVSRMIPFRPEYLDATEALFAEHQLLKTRVARRQGMQY
jgi:ABC-type phosphate/phosphonate transport system substrate-binding protein